MVLMAVAMVLMTEQAAPVCTSVAAPPLGFAGWAMPGNRPEIGKRFDVSGALAVAGETVEERARGGRAVVIEIAVLHTGRYAVALGDAAWIDIAQDGRTLSSTGHDHGPACSGIRKIVRFDLAAGRYQLRLSGMKAPRIGVMIVAQ